MQRHFFNLISKSSLSRKQPAFLAASTLTFNSQYFFNFSQPKEQSSSPKDDTYEKDPLKRGEKLLSKEAQRIVEVFKGLYQQGNVKLKTGKLEQAEEMLQNAKDIAAKHFGP